MLRAIMTNNTQTIRNFIAAWSRLDVDELLSYFTADGTYYNMPIAPVSGQAALRVFIERFIADWTKTEWEVLTILAADDTVIAERMDRTQVGDKTVELPCCGVFEMQAGKIHVWRDYFDMRTYLAALKE